jgi:plasmid stabilization system protein ParE
MATVKWLPAALDDVQRLYAFLHDKDQRAAARAAKCILRAANLLKTVPRVGRPMPDETGRHELFVAFGAGAYVLRYMLEDNDAVVIVRVWHSRESRL